MYSSIKKQKESQSQYVQKKESPFSPKQSRHITISEKEDVRIAPIRNAKVIQSKPIPVDEYFDEIGEEYMDDEKNEIHFINMGNNTYLYDERMILKWDGTNYTDSRQKIVNIANLQQTAEHTLVVGMGEMGIIRAGDGKFANIITCNASPCLILTIQNDQFIKMAHIYKKNSDADINSILSSLTRDDNVTLATFVQPNEKEIIDAKGVHSQEYALQKQRRENWNAQLQGMVSAGKIKSYVYNPNMENATASFGKEVSSDIHQDDLSDLITMMMVRSKKADSTPAEIPLPLKQSHLRTSNVMDKDEYPAEDIEYFSPKDSVK